MKRILTIAAVFAFSGAFMAACGSNKTNGNSSSDTTRASSATNPASGETTAPAPQGATVTLVAKDISFDQTALTAKAGSATTFVIKNEGNLEHNLTIEGLKVDKDVKKGESAQQTVTPTAGTYAYHCHYHPDAMKGTLTVS